MGGQGDMMGGGSQGMVNRQGNNMLGGAGSMNDGFGMGQSGPSSFGMGGSSNVDNFRSSACQAYATTGRCPNGQHCRYAHSAQELRAASSSGSKGMLCTTWLEEGKCMNPSCGFAHSQKELNNHSAGLSDILKAEVCRNLKEKGFCQYGDMCQFSHNYKRDFQSMMGGGSQGPGPVLDGKYKVVLCDKYPKMCDMGDRCHYAHGYEELHYYRVKQVPNYKKTLCKSWDETGKCQWEKTCMFAHGTHELRLDDHAGSGGDSAMYFNQNKDFSRQNYGGPDVKRMRF